MSQGAKNSVLRSLDFLWGCLPQRAAAPLARFSPKKLTPVYSASVSGKSNLAQTGISGLRGGCIPAAASLPLERLTHV